jgi:hypothetical protein
MALPDLPSIVLPRDFSFSELHARLDRGGWHARPVAGTVARIPSSIIPGETELAQWRLESDGTLLTYTFNPVVSLRVLHVSGEGAAAQRSALAAALPAVSPDEIGDALASSDARTVLWGILAAAETDAVDFADRIGLLAAHRDPTVAERAARVHLDLLHSQAVALATTDRSDELSIALSAICGNALPLLAALPGATSDEMLGLQPSEEDCRAVFAGDVGLAAFQEYDELWRKPPTISPGAERNQLQVRACPASLFASENQFSNAFPAGYRGVAPYLQPDRVWLAWKYCAPGSSTGLAFDGLVHVGDHWVWFPKVYHVVARFQRESR